MDSTWELSYDESVLKASMRFRKHRKGDDSMIKTIPTTQPATSQPVTGEAREVVGLEFALPNAASAADAILAAALGFCAQKKQLGSSDAVLKLLKSGDRGAREYLQYGIAAQVAELLGGLDDEIQAVYLYDDEATPDDAALGEVAPSLIHLIILANRKTSALDSLIVGLSRAVVQSYGRLFDKPQLRHLLDVQVMDNTELEAGIGMGVLMSSLHHRPALVWKR
jgi:hypothetical protein